MNVSSHIERGRRIFPHKPAIIAEDQSYSYAYLDDQVNRVGNALRGLGIAIGDRVAIYLPNSPDFAIVYLAILKVGAIAVSINALFKRDEVQHILEDASASILVTTRDLIHNIAPSTLPNLHHIIICQGDVEQHLALADLMTRASTRLTAVAMDRNAPAAMLYTSGTTGLPKGALLSHGNIISNMYSTVHHNKLEPSDRLMLFLPIAHVFGQNAIMNSGFAAGATLVMQQRFDPERVLHAVQLHRVTCFHAVPTIYIYLLNMPESAWDMTSVRYYFTAAATMPSEIALQWYEKTGFIPHEGYGMTECSPMATYNHDFRHKLGSIGEPVENVELKVVDEAGNDLPPGAWGELIIRGPGVMLGYWNKPEETARTIRNGWLHSGDIGMTDDEGYFYVVDRIKDMINAAGFKIYPAEVEQVLYRHPQVKEAAVYGKADPVKGETVVADVVLKDGAEVAPLELIDFVRQQLAVYKAPRQVNLVAALPKNATGKVLKRVLRTQQ